MLCWNGQLVKLKVLLCQFEGGPGRLYGNDFPGSSAHRVGRKRSGVGKAVKNDSALGQRRQEKPVIPLIEKKTGFLPSSNIDQEFELVLFDRDHLGRRLSPQCPHGGSEPLLVPHAAFALLVDPFDREETRERLQDDTFLSLHSGGEKLADQIIAIAIDDQTGKEISLSVD